MPSGDSVLKASGLLDPIAFGPPDEVEVKSDGEVVAKGTGKGYRRSIYLKQRRSTPVTMLDTFDAPQLRPNCLRRTHSTVSSQALQMMNSEMIRKSSRYMAGRVIDTVGEDVAKQVERVYLAALSPTSLGAGIRPGRIYTAKPGEGMDEASGGGSTRRTQASAEPVAGAGNPVSYGLEFG